jgi:hypothetical protein
METSHSPTVQQTQEMRKVLQQTILLAIQEFEDSSGCRVEAIDLGSRVGSGRSSRIYGVQCRVVL